MQRTFAQATTFSGIGLHSGNEVTVSLLPAEVNTGIIFRRVDLTPAVDIAATAVNVTETTLSTRLSVTKDEQLIAVYTIEHLMSALAATGIDNAVIEIDANEVPIMDGSAKCFLEQIFNAGIAEQTACKKFIKITKPVHIEHEDKTASIVPHDSYKINYEISFDHPAIASTNQEMTIDFAHTSFIDEVAQARTFGFEKDLEYMRANNLALGGSLDNAVLVGETAVVNPEGLRYKDEFVRHKVLDAVGDLYLGGHGLIGEVTAFKAGHYINNLLIREVLANPDSYELVELDDYQTVMQLPKAS